MHKLTRISYNSEGWQRPTGDAREYEAKGTFNHKYGFGHEDWLFRSEWLIDGWRYAFIEGVKRSHAKLVRTFQPIDLTLFTIQPDKRRRFVASIRSLECLNDQQAEDALKEFKDRGWYDAMRHEIRRAEGDDSRLGAPQWAKHVLNVRFRLDNVVFSNPNQYVPKGNPILKMNRYMLYDLTAVVSSIEGAPTTGNRGSNKLPNIHPFMRSGTAPVECTPEHARIQTQLMKELNKEYPGADIRCEEDFIDVKVQTKQELILFEIKSDLDPKTVIRYALGQILEYAYHPSREHSPPVRLVIVGRNQLSNADAIYMTRLKQDFGLPIEYRVVSL